MGIGQPFVARDEFLIRPLIPVLRRFAFGLTHDWNSADDLVQDCLEKAIKNWQMRREEGSLRAWLFTILHNNFINGRRQLARRGATVAVEDLEIQPSVAGEQEQYSNVREVLAAIDRLPDDHRALLLLIAVEEFTYQEAAEILEVPIGTVMSRLSRARQKLRQELQGSLVE